MIDFRSAPSCVAAAVCVLVLSFASNRASAEPLAGGLASANAGTANAAVSSALPDAATVQAAAASLAATVTAVAPATAVPATPPSTPSPDSALPDAQKPSTAPATSGQATPAPADAAATQGEAAVDTKPSLDATTGAPDATTGAPDATTAAPDATTAAPKAALDAAGQGQPAATGPTDLWERIRRGFKMHDLVNKRATSSTRWYAGQPDYISRMSSRASMYLFHIVQEIERRGMPTELALLPFVESAMQPEAVSTAKAAGLWQFIPSTGRLFSLEQNLWTDERFGVIESTRAALDYLQQLYGEFGDWQLALAAYNCGEAGVERALARNRAAHRPLDYTSLRLPRETQYYVPKLQAIKNIIAEPQKYGIELPGIRNEPYFVALSRSRDIDVATAAHLADMSIDDFRALNPAFNRPVIGGAG
jgi:membrane-bound lytic murein transglycosylase D